MPTRAEMISALDKLKTRYSTLSEEERKSMSESDTRAKFIDDLLKLVLGWDENFIHREKPIETKGSIKHSDYWYPKIPKIIVEAKKLSVDINSGDYDKQVQEYAYNKAVNWAILTNFEIFKAWYVTRSGAVSFCNLDIINKSTEEIVDELKYFLSENVLGPTLDNTAKTRGYKLEEIKITSDLTESLNKVREKINNYLKSEYSSKYSDDEREELTQGIINRLIFIKRAEASGLEENKLEELSRKRSKDLYDYLKEIFKSYREEYDSDIFGKPKEVSEVEKITISDGTVNELLYKLRGPEDSKFEYNFGAIDVDVLGSVYENYLEYIQKGKKLVGGKSKRKEQGIYYTPRYIVDYIIKNTLGERLKDCSLAQAKTLKILDPACGSGSFIISTINTLNEFYEQKWQEYGAFSPKQKLEVLKNNIYGVDLDEKAVKIAELNIYLTILSLSKQNSMSKGELLPGLKNNIKVGNSLIDDPKTAGDKAFVWKTEFKEILENGGFDIIIGNPPYVRIQTLDNKSVTFFNSNYRSATKNYDLYTLFVERGFSLLKKEGILGFILPSKFFNAEYGIGLRNLISGESALFKIVNFCDFQIFESATTYTCLLFLKNKKNNKFEYLELAEKDKLKLSTELNINLFNGSEQEEPNINEKWNFTIGAERDLMGKLIKIKTKLKNITMNISQGFKTGNDKIFVSVSFPKEFEKKLLINVLKGNEIRRWSIPKNSRLAIFPYEKINDKISALKEDELKKFSKIYSYLLQNKRDLLLRDRGRINKDEWFLYSRTQFINLAKQLKIVTRDISQAPAFAFDSEGKYGLLGGYGIILNSGIPYEYVLAILNSNLSYWFISKTSAKFRGGFFSYEARFIENIPIIFSDEETKKRIVKISKRQIEIQAILQSSNDKKTLQTDKLEYEAADIENEINELIYKIYNITDEDKKTIESSLEKIES